LRAVVDALAASTGGGVTYLRSLLRAALAADAELELTLVAAGSHPFADLAADPRVDVLCPLGPAPRLPLRVGWELSRLGHRAADLGGDVVFCPSELAPLATRLPLVVGFQNPNLYERPVPYASAFAELRLRALAAGARASARRATALVFVSEPFRRVATRGLPSTGASQHVIEPGLDEVFSGGPAGNAYDTLRPYVLSVSDFYPYKNFPLLVEAFAALDRSRVLRLVIAGRPVDHPSYDETVARAAALGIADRVVFLGAVPLAAMPGLYSAAECFVFPSLLESFGFPPIEALACGVPVACARASVMPDLLGDSVAWFDGRDARACSETMARLLTRPEERERARAAAPALRARFSGVDAGAELARVLRAAAGHGT
jgi:alpha-1,3-rhamnosyl/mannosyltransferase